MNTHVLELLKGEAIRCDDCKAIVTFPNDVYLAYDYDDGSVHGFYCPSCLGRHVEVGSGDWIYDNEG